jgi:hypothetical protein
MINNIASLRASLEGNSPSEPKPADAQPPQVGLDDD